jgi:nucleotidyltransferase substrate binding protein (TIGR01987 family)
MNAAHALDSFAKGLAQLDLAIPRLDSDPLLRDGAIQRFEFTFELAWKALRGTLLEAHGVDVTSPKSTLRAGKEIGLIADEDGWLRMLEDRNLTSQTYREPIAIEVASRLPHHAVRLRELLKMLEATR